MRILFAISLLIISSSAFAEPMVSPKIYQHAVATTDFSKRQLSVSQWQEMVKKPDTVILDLRSAEEFKQSHIKNAVHLGADIDEAKLAKLVPAKDSTVLIYCRNSLSTTPSRMLSLTVSSLPQFHVLGYTNVYYLDDLAREPQQENAVKAMMTHD